MDIEGFPYLIRRVPGLVLNALLPPRCPLCKAMLVSHGHLCADCWSALVPISDPKCERCALPFAHESDGLLCGACLASPPEFDRSFAPVLYDGKGRDLVLALKHGGMLACAPVMARMMATTLLASGEPLPDLLIPVPLHRRRLLSRRFNQSQLLAAAMARELAVPVDALSLARTVATPSQGEFDRKGRFKNVRSAFSIATKLTHAINGKNILIVDDVLTTGATAGSCASALKNAGAAAVNVIAFARVGHPISG